MGELFRFALLYRKRNNSTFSETFQQMYSATDSKGTFEYTNSYKQREFDVAEDSYNFKEFVFVCPLMDWSDSDIFPYYVSKEYNVALPGAPYKPGRFLFGIIKPELKTYVMLAEEPAAAFTKPGFNVEMYYLQIRRHAEPGTIDLTDCKITIKIRIVRIKRFLINWFYTCVVDEDDADPLCRLVPDELPEQNQHYRLCVAVSRSSYFKSKVLYPGREVYPCVEMQVSFRTKEALEVADDLYYEKMIPCESRYADIRRGQSLMYISRAYKSNEVFVYTLDFSDGNIYLENLSTNISIIDEINSFDFVED